MGPHLLRRGPCRGPRLRLAQAQHYLYDAWWRRRSPASYRSGRSTTTTRLTSGGSGISTPRPQTWASTPSLSRGLLICTTSAQLLERPLLKSTVPRPTTKPTMKPMHDAAYFLLFILFANAAHSFLCKNPTREKSGKSIIKNYINSNNQGPAQGASKESCDSDSVRLKSSQETK